MLTANIIEVYIQIPNSLQILVERFAFVIEGLVHTKLFF